MIGEIYTKKMIVEENDLATKWGSGKARVFSTPAMIAFMELTSTECVQKFLEEGYITVGTMVNIKHLKASPIKSEVICTVKITAKNLNEVTLDVKCEVEGELIGIGEHKRYIVNKEKFEKKYAK